MEDGSVRVAVHVRPLLPGEVREGGSRCLTASEADACVAFHGSGAKRFTFDHVFEAPEAAAPPETSSRRLYESCVAGLLDGCFTGLNATVLAYGQTGSGKTFTMSSCADSVIPRAARGLFERAATRADAGAEVVVEVSFFEIYREELFDLLAARPSGAAGGLAIREDAAREVFVAGLTQSRVRNEAELLAELEKGCRARVTGSTEMNHASSRSHAIFTVHVKTVDAEHGVAKAAKLHLVDLAGSERAKRTKAQGDRLKEGIDINRGLLALGNVISALGDESRAVPAAHIPYRDSKLTRILQDSLGGNSRTLMVACVSPADTNFEETYNTLKYANRARNIRNKAVENTVRVDGADSQLVSKLRQQVATLREELRAAQSGQERPVRGRLGATRSREQSNVLLRLSERNMLLETKLSQLGALLRESGGSSPVSLDSVRRLLEGPSEVRKDVDEQDDEGEEKEEESSRATAVAEGEGADGDPDGDARTEAEKVKEQEAQEAQEQVHLERQVAMQTELQFINDELEDKLRAVEQLELSAGGAEDVRSAYSGTLQAMCEELAVVQQERDDLAKTLELARKGAGNAEKEKVLRTKLRDLEARHKSLMQKQAEQAKAARIQAREARGMEKLKSDIVQLKQAKVRLVRRIKEEADEFRRWKAGHDKQLKQLRRQEQKQQYRYTVLERQHEKQQRVLQRKQEEAALAQRRLKELLCKQRAAAKQSVSDPCFTLAPGKGDAAARFEEGFGRWLEEQVHLSVGVRGARRALQGELRRRKELAARCAEAAVPKASLVAERDACTARISELQTAVLEAEESNSKGSRRRWGRVRSLPQAKDCLKVVYRELVAARDACDAKDRELQVLADDLDDMQHMFLQREHELNVEMATLRRTYEDKLSVAPQGPVQDADAAARIAVLEDENESLLHIIQTSKVSSASKKKAAAVKRAQEEEEEAYASDDMDWLSDSSGGGGGGADDDDDDEEWTEEEPARARAAATRKKRSVSSAAGSRKSSGSQAQAGTESKAAPSADASAEMVEIAISELPAELVKRVDAFKVKDLQNALFFIGMCVSGRKDSLRGRLLCALLERHRAGRDLLPESLPNRHEAKPSKAAGVGDPDEVDDSNVDDRQTAGPSLVPHGEPKEAAGARSVNSISTNKPAGSRPATKVEHAESPATVASQNEAQAAALEAGSSATPRREEARPIASGPGAATRPAKCRAPAAPRLDKDKEKENSMAARLAAWRERKEKVGKPAPPQRRALGPVSANDSRHTSR